jgi:hypothetical protein
MYEALEKSEIFNTELMENIDRVLGLLYCHEEKPGEMLRAFIAHDKKGLFTLKLFQHVQSLRSHGMMVDIAHSISQNLRSAMGGNPETVKRHHDALQYFIQNFKSFLQCDIRSLPLGDLQNVIVHDPLGLITEVVFASRSFQNCSQDDIVVILKCLGYNLNQAVAREDHVSTKKLSKVLKSFLRQHQGEISELIKLICSLQELEAQLEQARMQMNGLPEHMDLYYNQQLSQRRIYQMELEIEKVRLIKAVFVELMQSDQYSIILDVLSSQEISSGLLLSTGILSENDCMIEDSEPRLKSSDGSPTKKLNFLRRSLSSRMLHKYSGKEEDVRIRRRQSVSRLFAQYRNDYVDKLKAGDVGVVKEWMENGEISLFFLQRLLKNAARDCPKNVFLVGLAEVFSQTIYVGENRQEIEFWKYIEGKIRECTQEDLVQQRLIEVRKNILEFVQGNSHLNGNLNQAVYEEFQTWLTQVNQRVEITGGSTGQLLNVFGGVQAGSMKEIPAPTGFSYYENGHGHGHVVMFPSQGYVCENDSFPSESYTLQQVS